MVVERDFTLGGEHKTQCADDVLLGCTRETCMVLLDSVSPINSTKKSKTFLRVKGPLPSEQTLSGEKTPHRMGNTFANHIYNKGPVAIRYKELLQFNNKR